MKMQEMKTTQERKTFASIAVFNEFRGDCPLVLRNVCCSYKLQYSLFLFPALVPTF